MCRVERRRELARIQSATDQLLGTVTDQVRDTGGTERRGAVLDEQRVDCVAQILQRIDECAVEVEDNDWSWRDQGSASL